MQNYGTDKSRNTSRAAGTQGQINPMVAAKLPGVGNGGTMSSCKPGSKAKAPAGFTTAVINGKV